ncbi:MAG: hypothetical protein ACT4RN_07100 [Pseudonocardia sp.]
MSSEVTRVWTSESVRSSAASRALTRSGPGAARRSAINRSMKVKRCSPASAISCGLLAPNTAVTSAAQVAKSDRSAMSMPSSSPSVPTASGAA